MVHIFSRTEAKMVFKPMRWDGMGWDGKGWAWDLLARTAMPYFFLDLEVFLSVVLNLGMRLPSSHPGDQDKSPELAGRGWMKVVDRSFSRPEATMG
jgi:hypothetical protein